MPGRKRKTVLYWGKLMREAGMDWTDIERRTKDRKEWKRSVRKQLKDLLVKERYLVHKSNGVMERRGLKAANVLWRTSFYM